MNFNSPIDKVSVINPDFSIVLTTSLMYVGYKEEISILILILILILLLLLISLRLHCHGN